MNRLFLCIFLCAISFTNTSALAFAQDAPPTARIRYEITFPQVANHYVSIKATFEECVADQEVFMPVWTPGSYLVREYARHVDSVSATNANGDPLAVAKVSKNRWGVSCEDGDTIHFHYRIYCNELTVRTNFVDSEFALLNGAATFMTISERQSEEHLVTLVLPSSWQQAITSLERRVQLGSNTFGASSFDELVDSPIVAGNPTLHPFEVGGVEHYLVNLGGDRLWDGDRAAADVAKVVETHQKMWATVPYDRYFFLNVIAESGGGLEHDNSTVMLTSRWSYRSPRRYQSWLGLVSHEFFHTWNVRRLRPKALVEYDYETENYFDELWVAEGVTSYYDDLALVRAGHTSAKEYLSALSRQIQSLETTEGRNRQSLAESSHDAWIKYYRPNENSKNTMISYYTKGAVVAWLLDIEIRKATDNEKSLDDIMRSLYSKHALSDGYNNDDVIAELNEIADKDWNEWLTQRVNTTAALDYQSALDWLGLTFPKPPSTPKSDSGAAPAKTAEANSGPLWTGISTKSEDGRLVVSAVVESGPGFEAGLNTDDEIIAVNNYRVSSGLSDLLDQFEKDGQVDLLVARRGALSTKVLKLMHRRPSDWKLRTVKEPTADQKSRLAAWLHQPIPETDPKTESKDEGNEDGEPS
ncbi:MAG: M61 family metallopeptidase [Aureliella sp.]